MFGGKTPMDLRFSAARWSTLVTGAPILHGAIVSFDCQISQLVSVGTHDILFCQVVAITRNDDGHGLAYFDRRYHSLLKQ